MGSNNINVKRPSMDDDNQKQATIALQDERIRSESLIKWFLGRPEFASFVGVVTVFIIFGLTAGNSGMFNADGIINWMQVVAYLGLIAVGACVLMIAGEFDLSIGSMIGFAGMMIAIPTVYFQWPFWLAVLFAFAGSMAFGWLNGYLVVKSRLHSFIVSLAFMFILRGLTLALSIIFADRTIVSGVGNVVQKDWLGRTFFAGEIGNGLFRWMATQGWISSMANGEPLVTGIPKVIVWWLVLAIIAGFVLTRTHFGNWVFAVGGDPQANAAANVGIPVKRVKITLFMFTAFCACLFAVLQVSEIGSASADRGLQKEFETIVAAVIGGTLLTGGFGSVIGACFGALIFGVVQIGITYTNIGSDWFRVFIGGMLLLAVVLNNYVRRRVTEAR